MQRIPTPKDVRDGVITSYNQFGRIDIPFIAKALGKSVGSVRDEALSMGMGFENPETGNVEVSFKYLSGNVREKLDYAKAHNANGRYDENIKALEKVVPLDIPAHLIEFTLGSDWLEPQLYTDYAKEKFGLNDKFQPRCIGGAWEMPLKDWEIEANNEKNRQAGVTSESLGATKYGHELMLKAMNNTPVVFTMSYKDGDGEHTETDKIATQAAEAKIAEMRDDFREWCRAKMLQEPDLAQRIQRVYNDTFNSIVPMEIDDTFVPKHFKGQVLEMDGKPFDLYPHQAKAVIRATMQPLMMAHEVGTGKTYSLIATAMEYRRLGMAKKPMIVVQNSTVGQFVSSAKELYPQAKILTMTESDRTQEGRAAFYAKIKYNDWDMIIIPQSVFDMIPDSEERKRALIQEKIDEKIFVINQAKESGNESSLRDLKNELEDLEYERDYNGEKRPKKGKRNAKKEAEAEENAATKARKQLSRKTDDVSDFDDMGIDALLVDEAHMYKHLGFSTSMKRGIKGVDSSYSERSAGLYLKVHAIFDKVGWRNVVFATGTPISNTAAEIWTFMKYLMPADEMRKNHIYYFDDFVRNFGRIEQTLEFATNGKFKEQNRFSAYTNLPELIRIWSVVTDTRLTKDAIAARKAEGEIEKLADKIPVMQDWTDENRVIHKNQARDIFLPQSPSLRRIMTAVRKALEEYEKMSGKEKRQHSQIPLTMYGIAARAAIDPRLVDSGAVDEAVSKTNEAVKEILKDLKDTEKYKGTTAVFSDVYCRKDITEDGERVEAFNLFDEIKRKLVEAGVPSNKIVIIKSGMSVDAKERAFARVNSGDVRVIMGTTAGLGTGVNIQERLYSEYHLDAPNRPMDYTQRTGRILRQGNLHKKWGIPVKIVRFGVKDSLDVTAYQRLATKSKFINSVMDYKPLLANVMELRVLEEDEEGLFDNPVAVLSGSQFAMLKAAAERELRKLKSKKEQYEQDQIYIERKLKDNKRDIERQKNAIELEKKRLAEAREIFPKGEVSNLTIDGIKVNGEERIATVIKERITGPIRDFVTKNRDSYSFNEKRFDYRLTFNGVPVTLTANVRRDDEWDETARKFVHTTKTQLSYSCPEFGIDTRRAGGGINGVKNLIQRFVSETASGKEFEEAIANYSSSISRMESDDEVMLKRRGKPFADEDKLKHQEEIVKDYTEKMKEEMKEKEKEYASMAEENTSSFNLDNAVEAQDDTETDDDEDTHYRSADNTAPSATLDTTNPIVAAQAIAAVNRLAKKLGLRVVYDSELESKGAYTVGTDYVRINLANCESVDDAVETLLHEGVAHFGLREMLDEDGMKEFISDILAKASPSIRAKIEQMSQENGWDMEYAAEEYVAELAQKTDYTRAEHSFWREVLQAIRNLISRITGRETYVTDDTIRKMLVASYENLEGRTSNVERESEDEFGGEGVTHYRVRTKQNGKTISINDRAAQKEYLLGDNFVSHLSGKEFEKEDEPLTKRVAKYYAENYGGKIERDNIGEVILDERGVKDSLLHGIGRNKAAAFAAVPEIIRDGAIIDAQANWKGRNRDSYTIAAPIEIGGEGYVGVAIVIHGAGTNNNHFYLHEVALQKSLHNESVKTGTEADPHQGDIAKLLKEIANANSDNIRFRTSNLEDIDELNARFNEELQEQIDGTQEKGHVYQLGKPGTILRSTGFPDAPIELSASHLAEKASAAHHPFNISEISGLPHALQHPLAVFAYGDKAKAQNAVVEIQHGDKNFIIGVHFNQARRGLIVSDIRGLYPKDNAEWLNWISQGKALYIDKKKIQTLLDQQRRTLAEVDYLDLDSVAKIVNFFENPNLIRFRIEDDGAAVPIQREATGEGNKRDHLTAQSSPILYLQSTAEKEAAVRDAAMKCGVEIELKPAREMTFNGKPLAGYWKDGKMYVCIEHCRDANDAVRTVLHEAVGHNGLRKLIGNDNMHAFCRDVYQGLLVEARRQIARKAVVQYGGNLAEATEEYLAEQAEIMDFEDGDYERNFWDTVREAIRKVLAKIGINIHLTQRDVRWLMWQSYNANKQGDILNEVKRQVVAHKLGFNLTQRAYESDGVQAVRFRRAIDEQSLNDAQLYDRAVNNVFGRLKESFVDMYQSVDEVIKQMEKSSGKKASEFEDPRLALNQQSSKALAALDNWDRYYNLPMKKAVLSLMQAMGGRIEDVERYVMLKHGLERNKLFAKRDALARHEKDHEDKLRRIARATSISKEDKQELIEAENARYERKKADVEAERDSVYLKLRKRDYSGLSSFYSEYPANMKQEKGETDEEYAARLYASRMPIAEFADENGNADLALMEQAAQKEIEAIVESAHKVQTDELWKRINAATKKTLKEQYDANVLSHAQYEELRDMFEYYVPLRGFADKTAEDFYDYYRNGGHGAFIPLVQKAKGRSSKAASPFGYIAAAESNAIAQNVKNEAKLTLYYFISNRPHSDIMTASETWFEKVGTDDEGRSIFRAVYPEFEDDLSRDEAKQAFEKWEKNMQEKAAAGLAYKGRNKVSIAGGVIRTVGKTSLSHVIPFKLAGRDMMFLVNANPRIAQAFNGELNYNAETNPVTRWLQGAMRLMSSLNTEMNPEFWISNLQRDLLFAMMSVNIKESKEYQREYQKNLSDSCKNIVRLKKSYDNGTIGDGRLERLYKSFVDNGGVTGYTVIHDNAFWERQLRVFAGEEKDHLAAARKAVRAVSDFGEAIEQIGRFTAFVTSVEQGKDIRRAIADAKELTVNFNRKGSGKGIKPEEARKLTWGKGGRRLTAAEGFIVSAISYMAPYGRRAIMFFNASIQGLNATVKLFGQNTPKALAWSGVYILLGAAQAALHAMLDGDDDDDKDGYLDIPDWERRNNALVGFNGVYFKWALPQEMRAFYGLGDMVVNHALGREPNKNIVPEFLSSVLDVSPVNPAEGVRAFAPAALVPAIDIWTNEDYKGAKVHNEHRYYDEEQQRNVPKWRDPLRNTSDVSIALTKILSAMTGGDDYKAGWLNADPNNLEHLWEGYTGGLGTTAEKTIHFVENAFEGEFRVKDTPFLRRMLVIGDERYRNSHTSDLFYYYRDIAQRQSRMIKEAILKGDSDKVKELTSGKDYDIMNIYNSYDGQMKYYDDAIREADDDEKKELMEEQDALRKEMIQDISDLD